MKRIFNRIPKFVRPMAVHQQRQRVGGDSHYRFALLSLATLGAATMSYQTSDMAEAKVKEFKDLDYCVKDAIGEK